jgi:hypothetical protein
MSDSTFEKGNEYNDLKPLECLEGMPEFDPKSFPSILMRENPNQSRSNHPRTGLSCDLGINPMVTAVCLKGHTYVGGSGLNGYVRNADRKMGILQSKIDRRGNQLAKKDFDKLLLILDKSEDDKERNKARSDYEAVRAKMIDDDALCKSLKREFGKIKENKEQRCSVAREEFATFAALFDVVIIGKNDLKQWHKGLSHASSSVLSALSLGTLVKKMKFKVSLFIAYPRLVWREDSWWK